MSVWFDRLLGSPTRQALELSARFTEHRQRVLAENVANIDTPDFHQKSLDPRRFQQSLADAVERANSTPGGKFDLQGDAQIKVDAAGKMNIQPDEEPAPNVLFQDGTNAKLETLMTDVQQNALSYTMALNLLRSDYGSLMTAIRGTVK